MRSAEPSEQPMIGEQPHARPVGRRARWLIPLAAVIAVLLIVAGIEGWRIVDAIVQAERSAVVPLPTRAPEVAFAPTGEPTTRAAVVATAAPTATSTPDTSAPTPTTIPAVSLPTETINVVVAPTPAPSATVAPTASVAATATAPARAGPTSTPVEVASNHSDGDDTSHLDVVRQVLGTGMDTGDPGRSSVWGGKTSLNILVVGIDRRPDGGDQNADVIIIAHLDLISKRVAAVSVPRDLLVTVPGIGQDKINSAYNYGVKDDPKNEVAGVAKVRDTVEDVFGVPIDGYVLVDFNGFKEVVDAIGGIDINVPYEIVDTEYPTEDNGTETVTFHAGMQHMDGDRALKYVRTRHADSDDGRRQRQMQVLQALFEKGKQLTSITRADKLILAAGSAVQTSFPLDQQLILARLAYDMDPSQIRWSSLAPPLLQPGTTASGAWVYVGDMNQIIAFVHDGLITDADRYPSATPGA
jgi:LCP family protein required for cell wall assembly